MYPKPSIVPPGGFHYLEKHQGTEIKLTGYSVDTLAEAIEKYRLNNGIPLGNPKQDVVDYICGNWPHFCNQNEFKGYAEPNPSSSAALASRVAAWTTKLFNLGADNFVSAKEAERRAGICRGCEFNKDFRAGGCSSCVQGVDRLAFVWLRNNLLKGELTALWHSVKACRVTGAHLQASIFANKQPSVSAEEQTQLPAHCWRKET